MGVASLLVISSQYLVPMRVTERLSQVSLPQAQIQSAVASETEAVTASRGIVKDGDVINNG